MLSLSIGRIEGKEARHVSSRQDPALAIEELAVARERLGLTVVAIGTCPGGRDFDDPALPPFFEACRGLDMAVFVHPATPLVGQDRGSMPAGSTSTLSPTAPPTSGSSSRSSAPTAS